MRPPRWLVFATIVGVWSAVRWRAYVVDLGPDLRVWTGTFVGVTTLTVGFGAFLLTCAIAYDAPAELTPAWVPSWMQRLRLRSPAQFTIVLVLMLFDCRTKPRPAPPEEVIDEIEPASAPELFCMCGFDESPGCQAMMARATRAAGRVQ